MKTVYRGHEITVTRERCLGGWDQLYYSIFRQSDGYECTSGHTEDESPVPVFVGYMKERVDAELADPDPWGESEDPFAEQVPTPGADQ
ncbi:hypothetical protein GG804_25965 [Sphingomonas histidinilytica]|uniref:hypothetical protein n=1 Tax=Rhizorhabdus histidinilytica TaxID=439228 RepID=UPI001ADB47F7|nr:hypothetical protein [Rhizorhabdus histidinilytica]MBO9380217.1 hypothetical protein [Rhizorhabdus histidinilytica]